MVIGGHWVAANVHLPARVVHEHPLHAGPVNAGMELAVG